MIFYIFAVFFPSLFLIPNVIKQCRASTLWLSLFIYLTYMLLSSLWSRDFSAILLWRDFRYVLYILSFILLTLYLYQCNRELPDAIIQRVTLIVCGDAAISIFLFDPIGHFPSFVDERLVGVGITQNPNPSGFIYGFFGIVALDYTLQNWKSGLAYVYAAGAAIIMLFVVLTQSNTSLLALITASAFLLLVDRRRTGDTLMLGLVFLIASGAYLAWSLGGLTTEMDIGFTKRWPIWQHALALWWDAPVFGQGYQLDFVLTADGETSGLNYAHSAFLASLRDGGLVGLALIIMMYFFAFRTALKITLADGRALYLSLLIFGVFCVLVDTDQVITRPRELWIILWLPLACLIARELNVADTAPRSRHPSQHLQSESR